MGRGRRRYLGNSEAAASYSPWVDVVVGPAGSATNLETGGHGRPAYRVLDPPWRAAYTVRSALCRSMGTFSTWWPDWRCPGMPRDPWWMRLMLSSALVDKQRIRITRARKRRRVPLSPPRFKRSLPSARERRWLCAVCYSRPSRRLLD